MARITPSFDLGTDDLTTADPAVIEWMHAFTAHDKAE